MKGHMKRILQEANAAATIDINELRCVIPSCAAKAERLVALHYRDGRANLYALCLEDARVFKGFNQAANETKAQAFFF